MLALQPFISIALQRYGPSENKLDDNGVVALLQLTHGTTSLDAALVIALVARLLALARFDATVVTPLADTDDVCKLTSDARGAVWICANLDHTPGLAALLAYAKALEAAHEAPITVIMDVIVPSHDQA
ncbi:hypothetical protein SDRG_17425, partial [Saprolegnia diclina VS20]